MPALLFHARRFALGSVLTSVVAASVLAADPAVASVHRAVVPGAHPAWAAAAADRGAAAGTTTITVEVGLDLQDEAGAEALAAAVSTPGDPQYRQGLAPADWISRFAPTQPQVDDLTASMSAAGLTVTTVPKSRLFVIATGTATQMNAYFATTLHAYGSGSLTRYAAASTVSLPSAAARHVAAVDFSHPVLRSQMVRASTTTIAATTCSDYWRQHTVSIAKAYGTRTAPTALCGYSAKQIRELYGLRGSGLDGRGQTIAVIDAFGSPTITADLATYSARNDLPAADYTESVPARSSWDTSSCGSASGWAGEQTMDLEAAHAVAPRAKLVYIGAADCSTGMDVAMSTVLDEGLASIVSNSYGSPALDTAAAMGLTTDADNEQIVVNLHQQVQAAGEGIGLYFASGDSGDNRAGFGLRATDFPASSPYVTAVGGTSSGLDAHGRVVFTAPWGSSLAVARDGRWTTGLAGSFVYGSGGGTSSLFDRPWYQTGTSSTHRTSSDVSAVAAPQTGFAVGMRTHGRYTTTAAGGTSLSTPIVAAEAALAQQLAGRSLGFLNPSLYRAAAAGTVRDVQPSSTRRFVAVAESSRYTLLVTIDRDSSLTARRGYDYPTGVGELTLTSLKAIARG